MANRFPRFTVTLDVIVTDRKLLMQTAKDRAERDGCKRSVIRDLQTAVHWLLDPGSCNEEGWEIENSSCEPLEAPE
jgi:hypothetical protein